METILVALLSASMFFDSTVPIGDRHIRVGFTEHSFQAKIIVCESQGLTNYRFWFDDKDRPWVVTRFRCSPHYG